MKINSKKIQSWLKKKTKFYIHMYIIYFLYKISIVNVFYGMKIMHELDMRKEKMKENDFIVHNFTFAYVTRT